MSQPAAVLTGNVNVVNESVPYLPKGYGPVDGGKIAQESKSASGGEDLRLFIRQGFTESTPAEQAIVQAVLDQVTSIKAELATSQFPVTMTALTGLQAENSNTFRTAFTEATGIPFTPANFRRYRLKLLSQANCMLVIRTGLSESGAFEISFNAYAGNRAPVFFAIWDKSPIKTTLLRELEEICPGTLYYTFSDPTDSDFREALISFFEDASKLAKKGKAPASSLDWNANQPDLSAHGANRFGQGRDHSVHRGKMGNNNSVHDKTNFGAEDKDDSIVT